MRSYAHLKHVLLSIPRGKQENKSDRDEKRLTHLIALCDRLAQKK